MNLKKLLCIFLLAHSALSFSMSLTKPTVGDWPSRDWLEDCADFCCRPPSDPTCPGMPVGYGLSVLAATVLSHGVKLIGPQGSGTFCCLCSVVTITAFNCVAQCHKSRQYDKREEYGKREKLRRLHD